MLNDRIAVVVEGLNHTTTTNHQTNNNNEKSNMEKMIGSPAHFSMRYISGGLYLVLVYFFLSRFFLAIQRVGRRHLKYLNIKKAVMKLQRSLFDHTPYQPNQFVRFFRLSITTSTTARTTTTTKKFLKVYLVYIRHRRSKLVYIRHRGAREKKIIILSRFSSL